MAELNNSGTGQWSETDANNTSPPPDGAPVGTFPNQAEGIWRAMMGALKRFWDRINGTVTTTGTAGAYVYTPANTSLPAAYVQGETYVWRANFTSVGSDTLDVNGLGAKPLYKATSSGMVAVGAGDVQAGQIVHSAYDATLNAGSGGFQIVGGPAQSPATVSISSQSAGNFAIGAANNMTLYVVSSQKAVATLPDASSGGVAVGYRVGVKNQSDGLDVTMARAGSDTIDGRTTVRVPGRTAVWLIKDSAGSWTVEQRPPFDVGDVKEWAADTLPDGGWAWLNAQTLSRTTYSGLFAVWGTAYGAGDGSTTFGVRDDRGRVKAGNDAMGGASAANRLTSGGSGIAGSTTGAAGGAETHALTISELATHGHTVSDPGHTHTANVADPGHSHLIDNTVGATGNADVGAAGNGSGGVATHSATTGISVSNVARTTGITVANTGSGIAHQNTQPTIICNYIVKT